MSRINVSDAITPAFSHMVKVLFKPFNAVKWLSLGFISILAASGGGGNSFRWPGGDQGSGAPDFEHLFAQYWLPIIIAFGVIFILSLIFWWLRSVFNFVYFDDIVRNSGAIREPFHRLRGLGTSLFLWHLGFGLIAMALIMALVGLPLVLALVVMKDAGIAFTVIAVVWAILVGLALLVAMGVITTLVNGLVSITMYKRRIGILEAWRYTLPILRANTGQVILYLLLLMAFTFGTGIISIPALIFVGIVLAIPFGGVALVGYLVGQAMGLTWTDPVIAVAVTYGIVFVICLSYLVNCVMQPAPVFVRAFSLVVMGQADESLVTIPLEVTAPATE